MPDAPMQYFAKLGLDMSEFLNGMSKSQSSVLAFYRDVTVSMQMTMMIFDRVIQTIKQVGAAAQELEDFSYQTGLTTDKIQQLQYAAVLAGTSFGSVSTSINKLSLSMSEAEDSSSATAKAFRDLGVMTDGRSVDEVFDETAAALVRMDGVTRRNAIAMDLFGLSYREILPYLDTYVSKTDEIAEADYLTDEQIADLREAKIAIDKLGYSWTTATGKAVAYITNFQEAYNNSILKGMAVSNLLLFGDQTSTAGAGGREGAGIEAPTSKWSNLLGDVDLSGMAFENVLEGMSDLDVQIYQLENIDLPALRDAWEEAVKAGDPQKINETTFALSEAERTLERYREELGKTTSAIEKMNSTWASTAVVGKAGTAMYEFMMAQMASGVSYETALQNWATGESGLANTESLGVQGVSTSSSSSTAQKLAASQGTSGGWSKGSLDIRIYTDNDNTKVVTDYFAQGG